MAPFSKPWLSFSDLVALLIQRGMTVADPSRAEDFLSSVSYYRLNGYFEPFLEIPPHRDRFRPDANFDQLRRLYLFDERLQDLLSEALSALELDIRTYSAHVFGCHYGGYGHTSPTSFFNAATALQDTPTGVVPSKYERWLADMRRDAESSEEPFIGHFRNKYTRFPDLPIWVATETMTFGRVARFLSLMKNRDLAPIAGRYRLKPRTLANWVYHLSEVRNVCAHHSRLWNRSFSRVAERLDEYAISPAWLPSQNKILHTLLIANRLLSFCTGRSDFHSDWKRRTEELFRFDEIFPRQWAQMDICKPLRSNPYWNGR